MTTMNGSPKYLEVSTAIEAQIRKGRWDGGKMPSVREVAEQHRVSVVTASRALQVLRDKGLIQTVERSGCYRVPSPTADRWALALRITPGEWQKATVNISRLGFETLARRDPMHLETELFPLGPGMADRDVLPMARQAKELGVRGVFLLPSRHSDEEMRLDERLLGCCGEVGLPVVLLERNLRGHNRPLATDLVAVDDLDGAARCTCHLLEIGRKRVAIIVASPTSSHNDRVAGYLYALHAAARDTARKGVEHRPMVLHQSDDLPSKEVYAALADQIRKLKIDGVVCYQDYTAIGLIMELLTRGLSVPKDVAVVGFDDLPIGNLFTIGVTTYAYPSEGIAEQAVRLMRERLNDPTRPPIKVVVPGKLIVRESTGGGPPIEGIPGRKFAQ
ncbi:MAG TPA: GntR family transcriptional regulator [Gemmataceae bacterium]|nr:GntR family transcriptional regulator [Gemmataceae bacterium]